MKKILILFFIIACLLQCRNTDNKELEDAWKIVKQRSLQKAEQGIRSTRSFIEDKDVPKDLLTHALASSHRLRVSSGSENQLDSLNFYYLRISNDSLDVFMPEFFGWLLSNQDSLVRPMYIEFEEDYMKAARSVDSAKIRFNEIAKKSGSKYFFN